MVHKHSSISYYNPIFSGVIVGGPGSLPPVQGKLPKYYFIITFVVKIIIIIIVIININNLISLLTFNISL